MPQYKLKQIRLVINEETGGKCKAVLKLDCLSSPLDLCYSLENLTLNPRKGSKSGTRGN